jgi:hypothetical protein
MMFDYKAYSPEAGVVVGIIVCCGADFIIGEGRSGGGTDLVASTGLPNKEKENKAMHIATTAVSKTSEAVNFLKNFRS